MPNYGNYPNFGRFSQTFGVNAKILGFYTLGTHYSWGYPNFESLPKMCYLDVVLHYKKWKTPIQEGQINLKAKPNSIRSRLSAILDYI